jgi:hypothetical protein
MRTSQEDGSDFVQLLREFMAAHAKLTALFEGNSVDDLSFASVRELVGEDNASVLYRLKERSHSLFRSDGSHHSQAVRREALFDLSIGSLFHEAMQLRESLYQREVYAPRLASLKAASDEDAEDLFIEFERILAKGASRLIDVVAEIRILLVQARDQLRRLLIERAGDRVVTRYLLRRRETVSQIFPERFEGLLEAMHGEVAKGLVEAARSFLESAYFVEAGQTLKEAGRLDPGVGAEVLGLLRYAEGMQAFLDGDYPTCLSALEAWADAGSAEAERDFARLAASALSRLERLVSFDEVGENFSTEAKALQLRLETAPV